MDTIIHPKTGETINLFSQEGLDTLNKFVNTYKKGGNLDDKINNLTNIYTNLQTQFNNIKNYFQKQDGGMDLNTSDTGEETSSSDIVSSLYEREETSTLEDLKNRIILKKNKFLESLYKTGEVSFKNDDQTVFEYKPRTGDDLFIYKFYSDEEYDEIKELYTKLTKIDKFVDFYVPIEEFDNTLKMSKMKKYGISVEQLKKTTKYNIVGEFMNLKEFVENSLKILHSYNLYHGDLLTGKGIHWGNIVADNSTGEWKYKLIDFGDKYKDFEIYETEDYNPFEVPNGKTAILHTELTTLKNEIVNMSNELETITPEKVDIRVVKEYRLFKNLDFTMGEASPLKSFKNDIESDMKKLTNLYSSGKKRKHRYYADISNKSRKLYEEDDDDNRFRSISLFSSDDENETRLKPTNLFGSESDDDDDETMKPVRKTLFNLKDDDDDYNEYEDELVKLSNMDPWDFSSSVAPPLPPLSFESPIKSPSSRFASPPQLPSFVSPTSSPKIITSPTLSPGIIRRSSSRTSTPNFPPTPPLLFPPTPPRHS